MSIVELSLDGITPGRLGAAFLAGAAAVVVKDALIASLWRELVVDTPEVLPWEETLQEIASNHCGAADMTTSAGDLFYFQPGRHHNTARKLYVRAAAGGSLALEPPWPEEDRRRVPPPDSTRRCWDLAQRLMLGMAPESEPPPVTVALQRIKYAQTYDGAAQCAALVENALGRWGRIGFAVDRRIAALRGLLDRPGVRDVAGAALALARIPARKEEGRVTIEKAHTDGRYFTALCSACTSILTQIHDGRSWIDLPLTPDALAILPGRSARRFGIAPTLHRVLQLGAAPAAQSCARSGNVTLLLGAK